MGIVLSVNMNKGGVGKTSLVTNLAAAVLKRRPKSKVLIVDTDGQGNAAMSFGFKPQEFKDTINEVFLGEKKINEVIVKVEKNLDLAPANDLMNTLEFNVLTEQKKYPKPFLLLKPHLYEIRDMYDLILIDTPPSLGLVAGNVLAACDFTIIPFMPELYAVQGLVRVIETLQDFQRKVNPKLQLLGIVGMMVDARTTLHSQMMQEARKYCDRKGLKLFETLIPRTIRYANAVAYEGKPAVWVDTTSPLVVAYFELLEEILNEFQKG